MTSLRQIESNRHNALKSTGPKTELGKQHSRCNATRHGLTAETVIKFLEDEQDYKAFELSVTSDFDARTAVERELVLRLADVLWRLRRATAIESGLLQIHSGTVGTSAQRHQIWKATTTLRRHKLTMWKSQRAFSHLIARTKEFLNDLIGTKPRCGGNSDSS